MYNCKYYITQGAITSLPVVSDVFEAPRRVTVFCKIPSGNQFIIHKKYFHSHANKNHAANPKNFEKNSSQSPHRKKRIHSNSSNTSTSTHTHTHTQRIRVTQIIITETTVASFTFSSYHPFISVNIQSPKRFSHIHTHSLILQVSGFPTSN